MNVACTVISSSSVSADCPFGPPFPQGNGRGTSVEQVRNFAGDGAPKRVEWQKVKVESPVSLHEQRVASGVHWTA